MYKTSVVRQKDLTGECWPVQFWGPGQCDDCEFKDTDECGGQAIRSSGKNAQGIPVPVGKVKEA